MIVAQLPHGQGIQAVFSNKALHFTKKRNSDMVKVNLGENK